MGMTTLEKSLIGTERADTEGASMKGAYSNVICFNNTCTWAGTSSGSACIRAASIGERSTVDASIRGANIGGTCMEGITIRVDFIIIAYIRSAFDKDACAENICTGSANAVKHWEINF